MTTFSVNAERSFSAVRAVNHLQHGVSSQTFKAQVQAGSWIDSPGCLMPTLLPTFLNHT
jgi:hypothetical protein